MIGKMSDENRDKDNQSFDGFQRLIEYVKREHQRLRQGQDPGVQLRNRKIQKYEDQKGLNPLPEMKKGLQLKTAA